MDKRFSLALIIVMNACAGLGAFDLIQNGSTAAKVVGFVAWLCGNVLGLLGQPVAGKGAKPPVGPAVALVLALSFGLVGCAGAKIWAACTLGQLPQIAQTVMPTFTGALSQDSPDVAETIINATAALAGLTGLQTPCIVKAIQADELARAEKVKGMRSRASINIVLNADYYLKKHPATACGDTVGVM